MARNRAARLFSGVCDVLVVITLLLPSQYKRTPWKNGGGTTTEIYIHPPGAGWDDFAWRVGIADIRRSGPFSSFPGIDRSIMLLDCPQGSSMRLAIDDRQVALPLQRFVDFRGEAATYGTLSGEPVRDFNVMRRRGRVSHRARFERLALGASLDLPPASWNFVFVASGRARVVASSRYESLMLDAQAAALAAGEPMRIEAMAQDCALVLAAFAVVPSTSATASAAQPADARR